MERVFTLLDRIKCNYGVYIGKKSLHELATFLSGYECAIYELTGNEVQFDAKFQKYIEERIGKRNCKGKHWDGILMQNYAPDEAFEMFYIYLEQFRDDMSV